MRDIMKMTTDYVLESLDMAIALGADIICLDGDLAYNKSTFMSPAQYDEFIFPYHKAIVEHVHREAEVHLQALRRQHVADHGPARRGRLRRVPLHPAPVHGHRRGQGALRRQALPARQHRLLVPPSLRQRGGGRGAVRETIAVAAPGGGYHTLLFQHHPPGVQAGELHRHGQGGAHVRQLSHRCQRTGDTHG